MKVVIINDTIVQVKEIPENRFVELQHECEEKAKAKAKADQEELLLKQENEKMIRFRITELENHNFALKKANFISVFTLFELKALKGEIEVEDESLLDLDTKVLSGEMSVDAALDKHEYLKTTFETLYAKKKEGE